MRSYPRLVARYPFGAEHTNDAYTARLYHWLSPEDFQRLMPENDESILQGLDDHHRLVLEWQRKSGYRKFLQKNDDFVENVLSGRIDVQVTEVERLEGNTVHFKNGKTFEADAIMCCTGYHETAPELLKGFGVDDVRSLYKTAFHPDLGPRVAFVGFARPAEGGVPACSEMVARYFALLCSGERQLPSKAEMRQVIEADRRYYEEFFSNSKYIRTLISYGRFMGDMAQLIDCEPHFEDYLDDPDLLYHLLAGACVGLSFRLRGPGADAETAKKVIRALPVALQDRMVLQAMQPALSGRVSPQTAEAITSVLRNYLDNRAA
jgi:dimethylaniline monooxygenase (N-oxide forming)